MIEQLSGYKYVGAGIFTIGHGGLGCYVKYKSGKNKITILERSARHMWISCPDRELYIVNDLHHAQPFPPPLDFDEFVSFSPTWPRTGINTGVDMYMANYVQYASKADLSPCARKRGRNDKHNQIIMCDSGGFQVKNEKFNYISPKALIDWYNENVDIGMSLDIPPAGSSWPGMIRRMALAQKRNNEIMLEHKRDDLILMNVLHGETLDDVNLFRSIVETDEIDRVGIGGAYYHTVLQSIDHACRIITSGKSYKHYHLLGVSNIRQLYPIMRMASKGIAPLITSDSSTFLQEAVNRGYFLWGSVDSPPRYHKIGDKTNRPNAFKTLPCNCIVCSTIKYGDIFSVFNGNTLAFLLMLHNLYSFTSYTRAMYDIISDASTKELKHLVRRQLSTRTFGRDESLAAIDYVDSVAGKGIDYANQKAMYFLNNNKNSGMSINSRSLFSPHNTDTDQEHDLCLSEDDPYRQRIDRILDIYINGEVKLKSEKVKKKERINKKRGHMLDSAGIVRIPGKLGKRKGNANATIKIV